MNKTIPLAAVALLALAVPLLAQAPATEEELLAKIKDIESGPVEPPPVASVAAKVTEITSTETASFDNATQTAVFVGDVRVKDPQFKLSCRKLTAYLKDANAKPAASPAPTATPLSKKKSDGGGGLKSAIAEGKVIIVQEKPNPDGKGVTRYVGRADRAEYDAVTGDMVLRGSPQVQEGINLHMSLDPSTVMILHRDGRTMNTKGPSRTVISDKPAEDPIERP